MIQKKILVSGIVQGVGFRPTVYRIAKKLNLNGTIRNLGNIVEIILEGEEYNLSKFKDTLFKDLPPIAKIDTYNEQNITGNLNRKNYNEFIILESEDAYDGTSVIPPDVGICDNCLDEITDPTNRRYKYPFNACCDCGARFTVIESVPYDRDKTSMDDFPLCDECEREYKNPLDRRYHAEAMCCEECGPSLKLYDKNKNPLDCDDILRETAKLLEEGNIIALKGIGGTHLVCKVTDENVVLNLRKRLNRPAQAFAVMSPNIETVKKYAQISPLEEETLKSSEKPIVVLKKNNEYFFADSVAPMLHTIGVMLPYTPLHHLLFIENELINGDPAYIMTSANVPGEPMMINNESILNDLEGIYDYALVHNRRIINRCDDSVVKYRNNKLSFIRRSRGYTPKPYAISKSIIDLNEKIKDANILALGPELDVTFTILNHGMAYLSQHIGNTNKYKTYEFLKDAIKHMMEITKTKTFDLIACDMHPQFFTTKLAEEYSQYYDVDLIKVQHHHAHGINLLNDNDLNELVFIASDGVGYGSDKTAWGGEILYSDVKNFERLGSLLAQRMPGGDLCTKYPSRMLMSILLNEDSYGKKYSDMEIIKLMKENYSHYFKYGESEIDMVLKQLSSNLNVGLSSSTGRVLDSVSAALGICGSRTYEGEAAMKLEAAAYGSSKNIEIPYNIEKIDGIYRLNTTDILKEVIDLRFKGENIKEIASAAQRTIAEGLSVMAIKSAEDKNILNIGATGGTLYNEEITLTCKNILEKSGYNFIQHKGSCCGDGSVSLGQSIVASQYL
ncbi:carbamoyltransferase HypF [uncultured Methanobrevibacter sp.]|uniref:carbamoyltransferase HypF n=1 Tax=uncultured Methanobrevibacter sp. TaxID=253161 RepID=UPI0025D22D1A|nr:carbamoyltransferase HypF [uncultured Methanobrevibacter sp.]